MTYVMTSKGHAYLRGRLLTYFKPKKVMIIFTVSLILEGHGDIEVALRYPWYN